MAQDTDDARSAAREARADAMAEKARAKAMRPWYKKKRFIIPIALVVLIVIASAAGGGDKAKDKATEAVEGAAQEVATPDTVASGRADSQKEDQEVAIGQSAKLSGYTATVQKAGFQQSLSEFEDNGYLVADVTIANRDDKSQPYNVFDWKLQTPNGQVIDPTITSTDQLGSGDLVKGGSVSGKVIFEIAGGKGDFYVIYKPDPFDAARGIWKVTV